MTGFEIGQYGSTITGGILIARLIVLGLLRAYLAFSCFLIFDLFQSFLFLLVSAMPAGVLDYRIVWMSVRAVALLLTLWTVYALLTSVLKSLPGILKFSRYLLAAVFVAALFIGISTIKAEYTAASVAAVISVMKQLTILTLVIERALTMSAFIALLAILLFFIVWFPVEIPRNLVMFSVGLVVYFGLKTSLLLARTYYPNMTQQAYDLLNLVNTTILSTCFVCWAIIISRAGQSAKIRIGHIWQAQEQERLIVQLETMNTMLLRARQ